MEEILAQQKITNSRLLRLENRNLELKNILANIMESSLSIKNVMGAMNSGLESLVNQNNTVITEIKNLSDETTNSFETSFAEALHRDRIESTEEEREAITRDNKVIDLLSDIKELLSIKPDDSMTKLIEALSTKESEENTSLFSNLPIILPGLPGIERDGRRAPVPGRSEPASKKPGKTEPAPKKPSRLGSLARGAGSFARGALRFAGPALALGAGAGLLEGYREYQKTGEMDKAVFGFAGGASEFLSAGLIDSEEVKSSLVELQSNVTDFIEKIANFFSGIGDELKFLSSLGPKQLFDYFRGEKTKDELKGELVKEEEEKEKSRQASVQRGLNQPQNTAYRETGAIADVQTANQELITQITNQGKLPEFMSKMNEAKAAKGGYVTPEEQLKIAQDVLAPQPSGAPAVSVSTPTFDVPMTENLMPPKYATTAAAMDAIGSSSVSRLPAGRLLEQSAATTTNVNVAHTTINNNNTMGGNTTLAVSGAGQAGNSSKPSFNKNSSR